LKVVSIYNAPNVKGNVGRPAHCKSWL